MAVLYVITSAYGPTCCIPLKNLHALSGCLQFTYELVPMFYMITSGSRPLAKSIMIKNYIGVATWLKNCENMSWMSI
jgi:hypothetical protein